MSTFTRELPTEATLVALAASRLPGSGFAIAAEVQRFAGWEYYRVATLRCEVPADVPEHRLAHAAGLSLEQVRGAAPAAVALAYLDAHLTCPPYLFVAHHGDLLVSLISRHAGHCPSLAGTALLDTAELGRQLRGAPATVPLDSYAAQLQIPRSRLTALPVRAELTARVFTSLTRQPAASHALAQVRAPRVPAPRLALNPRTA